MEVDGCESSGGVGARSSIVGLRTRGIFLIRLSFLTSSTGSSGLGISTGFLAIGAFFSFIPRRLLGAADSVVIVDFGDGTDGSVGSAAGLAAAG